MSLLLPSLIISILFLFLLFLKHQIKFKPKLNTPPGPPPLPIIGNLHQIGRNTHRSLYNLSMRYGPILHLKLGQVPTLVISSPSLAEQVLKTHDLAFCSRPPLVTFQEYSFNGCDVAAAPYGDHWRNLRKIFILELLSSKKLLSFQTVQQEETARMIDSIRKRVDNQKPIINLSEFVVRLTNTIINRIAFGYKSECDYGQRSKFQGIVEEANELMASFFAADYFPGYGWVDSLAGKMKRLRRNSKDLDEFYQEVIDQHLNDEKKGMGGRDGEKDIVDVLLELWKEGQINMEHIKAAVLDLFIAGTDTSSVTVIWAMSELMRNPHVMDKAQAEVRKVIGKKGQVDETDISHLQYLKFIVNEALRLHPPLPLLIPRETTTHCKVNGYDVAKKTRVLINAWAIGRDKEVWGNPEEFDPDRFIGSSVEYRGHDFQFIPFGAGRRICPGINFGITNVEIALANLLYAFNWKLPEGMKKEDIDMYEAPGIITQKKTELCLVATSNY